MNSAKPPATAIAKKVDRMVMPDTAVRASAGTASSVET